VSILNFTVEPDRALVAVDTLMGSARGGADPWQESAKLLTVPHLNAAVAVSGNQDLLTQVYGRILQAGGDFDAVCNQVIVGDLVGKACSMLEYLANRLDYEVRRRQTVVLVGWSPLLERMRALVADREHDSFNVIEAGWMVSPEVEGSDDPATVEGMLELAPRQVAASRRRVPECPIGGRLVVAELTCTEIQTRAFSLK